MVEHHFKQRCRTVVSPLERGSCLTMYSNAAQEGKDREGIMQNPVETAGRIWVSRMQLTLEIHVAVNNENLAGLDTHTMAKILFIFGSL